MPTILAQDECARLQSTDFGAQLKHLQGSVDFKWDSIENAASTLQLVLDAGLYDLFIQLQNRYYVDFVRKIETQAHHEYGFSLTQPGLRVYARKVSEALSVGTTRAATNFKVVYFLPNLESDLAHVEVLHSWLSKFSNSGDLTVSVAGFTGRTPRLSKFMADLESRGVEVIAAPNSHRGLIALVDWLQRENVSLFVPYSIPTLVPVWLELLGGDRVAWEVTKFPLTCFQDLRHAIVGQFSGLERNGSGGTSWHYIPPVLTNMKAQFSFRNGDEKVRFVSINREEKLEDSNFLSAVTSILTSVDGAEFFWTGRSKSLVVENALDSVGLKGRHHYIGWIDPETEIGKFDIFLDAFLLSGVVAAKAFSVGMPVIFLRGSRSWVEAFESSIKDLSADDKAQHTKYLNIVLAGTKEEYVRSAVSLAKGKALAWQVSDWQKFVANRVFSNVSTPKIRRDMLLKIVSRIE